MLTQSCTCIPTRPVSICGLILAATSTVSASPFTRSPTVVVVVVVADTPTVRSFELKWKPPRTSRSLTRIWSVCGPSISTRTAQDNRIDLRYTACESCRSFNNVASPRARGIGAGEESRCAVRRLYLIFQPPCIPFLLA
ncbi:uncharacterized protein M421DRAFT_357088 [Didymella exigua CBS 183.55]|uniref:Secreted protein n=1 Tax=Didymella exigua CBS 183.55 TaxID=1150837 RepID=A0A6A5RWR0_9PLEO|nr:uncharacterized protein M421DRAFT_357088 [Didymella exigua CBS 183.55]KAF1930716.1 hypothetical protein M421DRAFT_357088 [Didymella exigua CBS 183.55]